ncbi:carbonic anhydrase [Falsiroseomonas sp. HW251]|uniref:carbonic anhydrase n=1 Tax=Falsiroseomonas sp. HW251 TaxID=3390998 RepID=UPI003D31FFD8
MRRLIEGIAEFRATQLPLHAERFRALAAGQAPDTLMITCADSRVVPDLLVSTDPGDLFTMRNVGNLVPPADAAGMSTGDLSEASAIEYAVLVLRVRNIVVCGHSACGAMRAALAARMRGDTPNLARWLGHAGPARTRLECDGPLDTALPPDDQLSQHNVLAQIGHLMTYGIVREAVAAGRLRLTGWWFSVGTGDMYSHEPETGRFEIIEGEVARRMVERTERGG